MPLRKNGGLAVDFGGEESINGWSSTGNNIIISGFAELCLGEDRAAFANRWTLVNAFGNELWRS